MPPNLTTKRCTLSSLDQSDLANVSELLTNAEVRQYLGGPAPRHKLDEKLAELLRHSDNHLIIRLKTTNDFIGMISLTPHHDGEGTEISFQFLPDYQGQGFASETVRAAIANTFKTKNLNRLLAETQAANTASRKLLQRIGMHEIISLQRFGEKQIIYATKNKRPG